MCAYVIGARGVGLSTGVFGIKHFHGVAGFGVWSSDWNGLVQGRRADILIYPRFLLLVLSFYFGFECMH